MAEKKTETLVHPDGREWTTSSATERTNLIARGWTPKNTKKAAPAAPAAKKS